MKLNAYILSVLVLTTSGCQEFLDQEPITEPLAGVVLADAGFIEASLNGAYDPMRWEFNNAFGDSYAMTYLYTDVRSDDIIVENHFFQPHSHGFENFVDLTSRNVNIEGIWAKLYTGVARANELILGLQDVSDEVLSPELKISFDAEARFLRAYYYFELVKNFGEVPLFGDEPFDTANPDDIRRKPIEEVYAQIIDDLTLASQELAVAPRVYYGATQGAAMGLLAKVYLYNEEWQLAADYAQDVIDLGVYSLEPNYGDNWEITNEFGVESIFEVNYSGDPGAGTWNPYSQGSLTAQFFSPNFVTPVLGWAYNLVTPELRDVFLNEGDTIRREATVMLEGDDLNSEILAENQWSPVPEGFFDTWINSEESGGLQYGDDFSYSMKYFLTPEEVTDFCPGGFQAAALNHKVLRLAEVYLILAEAVAMGASGNGQQAFDAVRARVNLDPKPLTLENIKLERRLELATEWNRFHDLVRWGDAADELEGFTVGRDELLPIPFNEIIITGPDESGADILTQNPGYTN